MTMALKNPYLVEFRKASAGRDDVSGLNSIYQQRKRLCHRYAWAIPTKEAIACIRRYSPIVEVGAGTGYWASLLAAAGARIAAYDSDPPGIRENIYGHDCQYYPVMPMAWVRWENTRRKTLFICWPPQDDPMAVNCLTAFRGWHLIYIGESAYGCTATDDFFRRLGRQWTEIETLAIPQWDGIHDRLHVYERRP
jgi:hypothetical protein